MPSLPTDLENLIESFLVTENDIKKAMALNWPKYEDTPEWNKWIKGSVDQIQKVLRYGGFPPKDHRVMYNRWLINELFDDRMGLFACGEVWQDIMPEYSERYPIWFYLERLQDYLERIGYEFSHSKI